jgi:Flp pilus assembly protein TadG
MSMQTRTTFSHYRSRTHRRGGVVVEMIFVLLVLIAVTIGVIYFGVFYANAEQVALAARLGALEASQTAGLPITNGAPVPTDIVETIRNQLESSHIQYCSIRLEHNYTSDLNAVVLETMASTTCNCEVHTRIPEPPGTAIASSQYVRVTVCVPIEQVFPQQLTYFGVRFYDPAKTYEHTVLMRYEFDQ